MGRNDGVWEDQIERLHRHLDSIMSTEVPVSLGAVDAPERPAGVDPAAAALDQWGPSIMCVLDIGPSEEIVAVRPDAANALGIDMAPYLHGHLTSIVGALTEAFGRLESTQLEFRTDGVEFRRMTFLLRGTTTEVAAALGPGDATVCPPVTSRWHLGIRRDGP